MEERNRYIIHTADDEAPECGRCDHVCNGDEWCFENCGPKHGWNHYKSTERIER